MMEVELTGGAAPPLHFLCSVCTVYLGIIVITTENVLEIQVDTDHYDAAAYNDKPRYYSYVEQIVETGNLKPTSVVEIGIGNGFTTRGLRDLGIAVTTVDFDATLCPDFVASVCSIPLPSGSTDVSLCFEVLEHLPFDQFSIALRELARISREWVFISVPDCRSAIRLEASRGWLPIKTFQRMFSNFPPRKPFPCHFDGQHYWEIGKLETPETRVLDTIRQSGLQIERHYRLPLNPYHHFFMLKKV